MPIFVSVLLMATSSVFSATCRAPLVTRTLDSPYARQFNEAYQNFRREGERPARLVLLSQMIRLHRDVVELGYLRRSFLARLKTAKSGLFPFLFDADQDVRWAVAYAIACFEGEKLPGPKPTFVNSRTPGNEAMVKTALEVYLPRHQHLPFTYVSLARVEAVRRMVEVRVEVTNELHLDLSVGRPRLQIPDWVTSKPTVAIHMTSGDRLFVRSQNASGTREQNFAVTQTFWLDPRTYTGSLYLDIHLDGHEVDRRVLSDVAMGSLL